MPILGPPQLQEILKNDDPVVQANRRLLDKEKLNATYYDNPTLSDQPYLTDPQVEFQFVRSANEIVSKLKNIALEISQDPELTMNKISPILDLYNNFVVLYNLYVVPSINKNPIFKKTVYLKLDEIASSANMLISHIIHYIDNSPNPPPNPPSRPPTPPYLVRTPTPISQRRDDLEPSVIGAQTALREEEGEIQDIEQQIEQLNETKIQYENALRDRDLDIETRTRYTKSRQEIMDTLRRLYDELGQRRSSLELRRPQFLQQQLESTPLAPMATVARPPQAYQQQEQQIQTPRPRRQVPNIVSFTDIVAKQQGKGKCKKGGVRRQVPMYRVEVNIYEPVLKSLKNIVNDCLGRQLKPIDLSYIPQILQDQQMQTIGAQPAQSGFAEFMKRPAEDGTPLPIAVEPQPLPIDQQPQVVQLQSREQQIESDMAQLDNKYDSMLNSLVKGRRLETLTLGELNKFISIFKKFSKDVENIESKYSVDKSDMKDGITQLIRRVNQLKGSQAVKQLQQAQRARAQRAQRAPQQAPQLQGQGRKKNKKINKLLNEIKNLK